MGQEKPINKPDNQRNQNPNNDDHKTFGKEPPMVDPQTPEHPDEYEVTGDEPHSTGKPTLH